MADSPDYLKTIALETAQRLIDYGSYGQNESRAIAAMKKRCPGFRRDVYAAILSEAMGIHRDAIRYVAANLERIQRSYQEQPDGSGLAAVVEDFVERYGEFPVAELTSTVGFVYYLHHLR